MQTVEIYTVTTRKLELDLPECCRMLQVGCALRKPVEGYLHDNEGSNISDKNKSYCELTGLYWAWKNSAADIRGICHYRRFFDRSDKVFIHSENFIWKKSLMKSSVTSDEIRSYLKECDIILPLPYYPSPRTAREDLRRFIYGRDIRAMEQVIREKYPAYYDILENVLDETYCNMFIAGREVFDSYCSWLFEVLGEIEDRLDISEYDDAHKRVFGYLAEVLLNVWVLQRGLKIKFLHMVLLADYFPNKLDVGTFIQVQKAVRNPLIYSLYLPYFKKVHPDEYNMYLRCRARSEQIGFHKDVT